MEAGGLSRRTLVLVLVLLLASCGGGGLGGEKEDEPESEVVVEGGGAGGGVSLPPRIPNEPVTEFGYSANAEGVSGARLAGFLAHHYVTDSPYVVGGLERWGSTPPVVRIAAGATAQHLREVRRAVEIINSALPLDYQMTFDPTPREVTEREFGNVDGEYFPGEIVILFTPDTWLGGYMQSSYGREPEIFGRKTDLTISGRISVDGDDSYNGSYGRTFNWHRQALVIHEIGHALGIGGDTWANINHLYPDSIMTYFPGMGLDPNGQGQDSDMIFPLDRDSFLALYTVLRPGMTPAQINAALAGWTATAYRIQDGFDLGDEHLSFGAWSRGVWAESWADYTPSSIPLADNPALTGSATWNGRVAGLEPDGDAVRGDVALTVALDTLDGDVAFTDLRTWTAGVNPVTAAGVSWGGGSLSYDIEVTGTSFADSTGEVKGGFVGPNHEGMAGTLERDDLSAGFGGVR